MHFKEPRVGESLRARRTDCTSVRIVKDVIYVNGALVRRLSWVAMHIMLIIISAKWDRALSFPFDRFLNSESVSPSSIEPSERIPSTYGKNWLASDHGFSAPQPLGSGKLQGQATTQGPARDCTRLQSTCVSPLTLKNAPVM